MMRLSNLLLILNLAAITVFAGALLAPFLTGAVVLDMRHMDDTLFLTHLGWRGVNGLEPVLDYPHFYGGMTARFVTWAFALLGVTISALNAAIGMMFAASALVLWALGWGRAPGRALVLLTALAAALVMSLAPLELGRMRVPEIAHSFVYNHVGLVLIMGLTLFALKPHPGRVMEWAGALVAGAALSALVLLKTTFGVMAPCVLLACLVQGRLLSLVLVAAGAAGAMLLMDPELIRATQSLDLLLNSAAANRIPGIWPLLYTALGMMIQQAVPLMIGLVLLGLLVARGAWAMALSAVFCAAGTGAALLTMGGESDLKLLPYLSVFAVMAAGALLAPVLPASPVKPASRLTRNRAPSETESMDAPLLRALPYCLAYAVILPALAVAVYGAQKARQYGDASLIADGPLAGYVVRGDATRIPGMTDPDVDTRRAAAVAEVLRLMDTDIDALDESVEYVMLADGIDLLKSVPNIAQYGIIPNGRMFDFTFALQSGPVLSFPIWPTPALPGLTPDSTAPLGADIDLVMISRDVPRLHMINDALLGRMGAEFRICRRSDLWTLYARTTLPAEACTE